MYPRPMRIVTYPSANFCIQRTGAEMTEAYDLENEAMAASFLQFWYDFVNT